MIRYSVLLLLVIISACGGTGEQRVDTTAVQEEMAQREPKRVTPEQVTEAAYQQGGSMAQQMLSLLTKQYQEEKLEIDFVAYLQNQSVHTFAGEATIHWIPVSTQASDLPEKEQQILEAYRYSQEQQQELIGNVQRIGQDTLLYTHPVTLNDSLRVQLALPADTAQILLGMWSIYISKKTIVQGM
ncbi:hypothetical protein [Tunicatimonas pelagia]|uniref:hypothetical protein n=1 Tax=Tunicatimonas pelagia TaxID=931531 RepID=UPI00266660FF|nr:hypothetical protein [Tunicatimonas pelagia]WKN45111.1 hypothetical protein P0M28_09060 [Tunicatimonas pelagia]